MFIKKINKLFKIKENKKVEGVEVWTLTWLAYIDNDFNCSAYCATKAKIFLNKEDAELFAQSLKDANKFLQNETRLGINITKQK